MPRKHEGEEPRYVISIAAQMIGVQVHTLRYYERVGIISPSRSRGNIRLYSESDIELIRHLKSLMEDLGINLAGAEVVLRMSRRLLDLQHEVDELRSELKKHRE